jgi:hypothetical protein
MPKSVMRIIWSLFSSTNCLSRSVFA